MTTTYPRSWMTTLRYGPDAVTRPEPPRPTPWLSDGDIVADAYQVMGVLGEGGMSTVYLARALAPPHDEVAIKVLHAELLNDAGLVQRFEREAIAAGLIGSRHSPSVIDMGGLADGNRYLVMERLEGESLATRIERGGALSSHTACSIALQLLEGLARAHDAGIVHRDLKPANIFLVPGDDGEDIVKILDFGVSKFTQVGNGEITEIGAVLGTPRYMAPELRHDARYANMRSDLYSVGATLFKLVTGCAPHAGITANELLEVLVCREPPSVRELAPHVDEPFAAIVARALRCDPSQRFADARDFGAALRNWSAGQSEWPRQPTVRAGSVARWVLAQRFAILCVLLLVASSAAAIAVTTAPAARVDRTMARPMAIVIPPAPVAEQPLAEPTRSETVEQAKPTARPPARRRYVPRVGRITF